MKSMLVVCFVLAILEGYHGVSSFEKDEVVQLIGQRQRRANDEPSRSIPPLPGASGVSQDRTKDIPKQTPVTIPAQRNRRQTTFGVNGPQSPGSVGQPQDQPVRNPEGTTDSSYVRPQSMSSVGVNRPQSPGSVGQSPIQPAGNPVGTTTDSSSIRPQLTGSAGQRQIQPVRSRRDTTSDQTRPQLPDSASRPQVQPLRPQSSSTSQPQIQPARTRRQTEKIPPAGTLTKDIPKGNGQTGAVTKDIPKDTPIVRHRRASDDASVPQTQPESPSLPLRPQVQPTLPGTTNRPQVQTTRKQAGTN